MEYYELAIDAFIFQDVNGISREVRGCSLRGLEELDPLFNKLKEYIENSPPDTSLNYLRQLYLNRNSDFRITCDRLLELHQIEPKWVSMTILVGLLFIHDGKPGLLQRLNYPSKPVVKDTSEEIEALAALVVRCNQDLEKAIDIYENIPWKDVVKGYELDKDIEKDSGDKQSDTKQSSRRSRKPLTKEERDARLADFTKAFNIVSNQTKPKPPNRNG